MAALIEVLKFSVEEITSARFVTETIDEADTELLVIDGYSIEKPV